MINIRKFVREELNKKLVDKSRIQNKFKKNVDYILDNISIIFPKDFNEEKFDQLIIKKQIKEEVDNKIKNIQYINYINNVITIIKFSKFSAIKNGHNYNIRFDYFGKKYDYFYVTLYKDILISMHPSHSFFDDKISQEELKDVIRVINNHKIKLNDVNIIDTIEKPIVLNVDGMLQKKTKNIAPTPKPTILGQYVVGNKVSNPLLGYGIITSKKKNIITVLYPKDSSMFRKFRFNFNKSKIKDEPTIRDLKEYVKMYPYEQNINIWIQKKYNVNKI